MNFVNFIAIQQTELTKLARAISKGKPEIVIASDGG